MKQKDISSTTHTMILEAASKVVLEKGVGELTLDAVALMAGVSKGGLLYHFPSKNKLIEGMIERLVAEFDSMLEAELVKNDGDWLSAYIRASFQNNPKLDNVGSALFAAVANDPELLEPLRTHYAQWQDKVTEYAASPGDRHDHPHGDRWSMGLGSIGLRPACLCHEKENVNCTVTACRKGNIMKIALIFFFAVLSEVTATTALKFSEGFTKFFPSLIVVVGYGLSFYLLSLSLKVMPIGMAYALWSGIGIVLTVIVGAVLWHEQMDWARGIGIALIISGIVIINLFSKITTH